MKTPYTPSSNAQKKYQKNKNYLLIPPQSANHLKKLLKNKILPQKIN